MFDNSKVQYINVLHQNKQLKINYKILQDNKIVKEEHSSFLIADNNLPDDAQFKINTLQKNIAKTYISVLFEDENQHIISTKDIDSINYNAAKITSQKSIIIPKNLIQSKLRYYANTGIDYLLSPYTILEKYLQNNKKENSLNLFIYNNIIYTIIFNAKQEIALSKTKTLSPFESTQDETFLEDDILRQKLYEEIIFLEIQQFLEEIIQEYYAHGNEVEFLGHIEMLYTLRPISEEQIATLKENLMMPIEYKAISIDDYIDEIVQNENVQEYNFITVRKKEATNKNMFLLLLLIIFCLLVGIGLFSIEEDKEEVVPKQTSQNTINKVAPLVKKTKEIDTTKTTFVLLPNHQQKNTKILQTIQMLFDVVPYDALLKDIEIKDNSSTYVTNFIVDSTSLLDMQSKLNNIYQTSKVLLKHKNNVILNTIIENSLLLEQPLPIENIEYTKYNFLSIAKVTTYIKKLVIKNSLVQFTNKTKGKYLSYNFSITSKISSPKDFFDFISKINLQKLSVNINYPIVFSKTSEGLEVKYNIQFNQQNKKQPSLKK
ncbi:MAG: hypothetical protein CSA86_01930 [Arcobacter sp.]|nr:MAG: hypothetical protein CSA86_01930 [Arcobacter sp.]